MVALDAILFVAEDSLYQPLKVYVLVNVDVLDTEAPEALFPEGAVKPEMVYFLCGTVMDARLDEP